MSGHSKWSTIKHKKAKEDSKRGKIFTKLIREITVAAREGGGDPDGNPRLRLIIEKSKAVNMPQDNILRAIKKGTGGLDGVNYEESTYEGYGLHGTAVIVEVLSDNKNRTVADVRHILTKMGGRLAENGSVSWMFEHKGVIRALAGKMTEDDLVEKLLAYDIDDLELDEGVFAITCKMQELDTVRKAVVDAGLKVEHAEIEWVAKSSIVLEDKEQEESVVKMLEALEDHDDVQNVYTNLG